MAISPSAEDALKKLDEMEARVAIVRLILGTGLHST